MALLSTPLWLSGALLVGAATLLTMAGPFLVRRRVSLERLRINNEVAGFTFATVGVLYAVLLAFAVIIVWEKFSEAENAAAQEAGAVATLYRLADGIAGAPGAALRDGLNGYIRAVVVEDWPAMERTEMSQAATRALDAAYAALLTFNPGDSRGTALLQEALHQLDVVTQARRARLVLASGAMPGVLWFVLFCGAVVTIGFTLFFGTENVRLHALMTGILAFLIFSGLFVIVGINHPFAGSVKVQPEAISAVLDDFGARARP
jgi:Na+/proline symporter